MSSYLRLCLFKGIFPEGLHAPILRTLLPSSMLATWPAHQSSTEALYDVSEQMLFYSVTLPLLTLSRTNPLIATYFFNIHSNCVLSSMPMPFWRCISCRFTCYNFESTSTFFYSGYMPSPSQFSTFGRPDYIKWTVGLHIMKCLIVKLFPFPILILLDSIFASGSCFQISLSWFILP